MTDTAAIPTLTTADVETAIDKAIADGLPRPAWQVIGGERKPFINLGFATPADVDQWAKHVGATVGYERFTYGPEDGSAPFHQYGTSADNSAYGNWLGRTVYVGCTIPGPHPQPA